MQPEVLLAHVGDWPGISRIPRLFRRAGMRTTVLAPSDSLVTHSRYVDKRISAYGTPRQIIEQLREIVETSRYEWVVLADELLIGAAGERSGEPWLDHVFPVDHRNVQRKYILSKFEFLAACRAQGMPLPRSMVAASPEAALVAAGTLGYPVMLKRDAGWGSAGVRKVHDAAEAIAVLGEYGDPYVNVEEFVEGVVGATEVLYDHGVPVCWWSFENERRFPNLSGPSAIRRTFNPPGLEAIIRGCGAVTGFHGFSAICWIFDPQKRRIALLEMNAVPGAGMHLPLAEPMFAIGIRTIIEQRTQSSFSPISDGIRYRIFPQDFKRCFAERDLAGLLAWIPGRPTARDIPWDDTPLLLDHVRRAARSLFLYIGRTARK